MAIGDAFEIKIHYRDLDQRECLNTFYYRQGAVGTPPYGPAQMARWLCDLVNADFLTPLLPTVPNSMVFTKISGRHLFDPSDGYDLSINRAGTLSGAGADLFPTFLTVAMNLATDNWVVRLGRKAISGWFETAGANGVVNSAGMTIAAVKAALMLVQLGGAIPAGYVFQPIVIKRVKDITTNPPTYRLPETAGEMIFGYVTSVVASSLFSTQVTRKD